METELRLRVCAVLQRVLAANASVYATLNATKAELAVLDATGLTTVLDAADAYNFMIEHDEPELNGVSIDSARAALSKYRDALVAGEIPVCECLHRLAA